MYVKYVILFYFSANGWNSAAVIRSASINILPLQKPARPLSPNYINKEVFYISDDKIILYVT